MLTLKVIGCTFVILSCGGFGYYFSCNLKARIQELIELKKVLMLLRGNIRYASTPLPEALQSIAMKHDGTFKSFLKWVSTQMNEMQGKTFSTIWNEGIERKLKNSSLNKKDKEGLKELGTNLGYLDKEMQLGTIDLYIATLEAEIEEVLRTVKEKTYLYNSLGIMTGIFLTIILI